MKTVRQRILEHLNTHPLVSAVELGRALKMTPANARHHLAILIEEGAVQVACQLPTSGRGRPTRLYCPARQAQEHNLDGLASALLTEFLAALPAAERPAGLRRLAESLQGEKKAAANLTQRLSAAIQRLNALHYRARWEARPAAPHLILGHCPYAALLPEHPELCQMDAFLLESLLDSPVQQIAKLARDGRGATYCRFSVGKK